MAETPHSRHAVVVGNAVRELRKRAGLDQAELATEIATRIGRESGYTAVAVSRWETYKTAMPADALLAAFEMAQERGIELTGLGLMRPDPRIVEQLARISERLTSIVDNAVEIRTEVEAYRRMMDRS